MPAAAAAAAKQPSKPVATAAKPSQGGGIMKVVHVLLPIALVLLAIALNMFLSQKKA